jgi:hypothetical protein
MLENPGEPGIKLNDLFDICVEEMISQNLKQVKDYLQEAKDHNIVKMRDGKDHNEYIYIKYKANILDKIANLDFSTNQKLF